MQTITCTRVDEITGNAGESRRLVGRFAKPEVAKEIAEAVEGYGPELSEEKIAIYDTAEEARGQL